MYFHDIDFFSIETSAKNMTFETNCVLGVAPALPLIADVTEWRNIGTRGRSNSGCVYRVYRV